VKILLLPILIALTLLHSGLVCDRQPITSDCEPPGLVPSRLYLTVRHQVRLFDGDLTVRFDTVLSDDRGSGSMLDGTGLAMIRLKLTTAGGDSASIDMVAWSNPPYWDDGPFHTVDTLGYYITLLQLWSHQGGTRPLPYGIYTLQFEAIRKNSNGSTGKVVIPVVGEPEWVITGRYGVDTAYIQGDSLHMTVVYGGGCETHYFIPYLMMVNGPAGTGNRANLYLHHLDNRDMCEALFTRKKAFDLSPIKRLCRLDSDYSRSPRVKQIRVYEYEYDSRVSAYNPHLVTTLEYRY
jgi:hypothetical protein